MVKSSEYARYLGEEITRASIPMRSPAFAQSEGRITVDEWRRHIGLFTILMAPALIWLVVFFLLPLAAMFVLSFSEQSGLTETSLTWTFASYVKAFDPIYLRIIGYSIWIAAVTTIVCLIVGYPVAMAVCCPATLTPGAVASGYSALLDEFAGAYLRP